MKTCAFTGHRPQHLPFGMNENDERCVRLKEILKEEIINLIEKEDVTHFITGMALGIDLYAAEIVLDLKACYPSITLESAIPCETQAVKWSAAQRERYYMILPRSATKKPCSKATIRPIAWTSATATWSITPTSLLRYGTVDRAGRERP